MRVSGPLSGSGSFAAEVRAANRLIESIQENTVLSRRDRAIIGVIGYAWVPSTASLACVSSFRCSVCDLLGGL